VYIPPQSILARYADLLVQCALNGGEGVKKGEVVQVMIPDCAKPLYKELMRSILDAGAMPKMHFLPTETDALFFDHAKDEQLKFFPAAYKRAEADLIDHQISIIADTNPQELKEVDPVRLFTAMDAKKEYREWLNEKERLGKFSWTLALYGTEAMAKEAGMTLEEYWQQIILACYLDHDDPVSEWRKIQTEQDRVKKALNDLAIERVHVQAEDIDLWVRIGEKRQWLGGSMRNIPSFEIFVSPDWRGTNGTIHFNQPLYRYGNILRDVSLTFKDGILTTAKAGEGQAVLNAMIVRENADKIGEFSLTDSRVSRITKFMANTLFDENIGGQFGNTHVALGRAYKDSLAGDQAALSPDEWGALGFNESPEHTDIISTTDRTVTAIGFDEKETVIFKDGKFQV
jgi:aminopeptidase